MKKYKNLLETPSDAELVVYVLNEVDYVICSIFSFGLVSQSEE
jgi:hypothetical protein